MLNWVSKQKLRIYINPFENKLFDIATTLLFFLLLFLILNDLHSNGIKHIIIFLFIFVLVLFKVDEKIMYSKTKKSIKTKFSELYDKVNSGDIYLHISNAPHNFFTFIVYSIFLTLYQNDYYTHSGLVYKDQVDKKIYIMENVQTTYYCNINKKYKSGVLMKELNNSIEKTKDFKTNNSRKIFIFNTNIHKFITNKQIYDSVYKYKDYYWGQDNLQCSNLLYNIFVENGIMKEDFNDFIIFTPDMLLNPKNYSVDVQINKIPLLLEYD